MESQLPDAKSTQVDEASAALDTTAHRQAQQSAKCSDGSVSVAHDEPAQGGRLFHRQPRGLAATGHWPQVVGAAHAEGPLHQRAGDEPWRGTADLLRKPS